MIKNKQESEAEEILSAFNGRGTMYIQPAAPKEVIVVYIGNDIVESKKRSGKEENAIFEDIREDVQQKTGGSYHVIVVIDYEIGKGLRLEKL